jgi:hypothetical protein
MFEENDTGIPKTKGFVYGPCICCSPCSVFIKYDVLLVSSTYRENQVPRLQNANENTIIAMTYVRVFLCGLYRHWI